MNPILVFGLLAAGGVVLNKRASSDYREAERVWGWTFDNIQAGHVPAVNDPAHRAEVNAVIAMYQRDYSAAKAAKRGSRMLELAEGLAGYLTVQP